MQTISTKWDYYRDDDGLDCCCGFYEGYSIDVWPANLRWHFQVRKAGKLMVRSSDVYPRGCTSMDGAKATAKRHITNMKDGQS
jgi:hypothetical protein